MSGEAEAMGGRLQELRHGAGMSQSELADAAGVPVASLKNWEQGRRLPGLDAAVRLAAAMGISLDHLAGDVFPKQLPAKKPARSKQNKRKGA
jgi:transcriptional regulator with XRE-family HTH domain